MTFLDAVKLSRDEGVEVRPVGSKERWTVDGFLFAEWVEDGWHCGAIDIAWMLAPWERVPEEGA